MSETLLFCSIIMLSCVFVNLFSRKYGMPSLLLFMGLGMLFGSDGLFKIEFDDYNILQQLSTIALVFIIFYGGFSTKWSTAKPVLKQASLLSTFGVIITALFNCAFCYYVLNLGFAESFVIGAVISSTDAASVFSILRSKKLNLKDGTAPLLELESGSNDPFSYMLTVIGIAMLTGQSVDYVPILFIKQLLFGILFGVLIAQAGIWLIKKTKFVSEGMHSIFITAIVILAFALPDILQGNGLLSVYIAGIILGNAKIKNTNVLVNFFDGITSLAQIWIFFLLGLTAFPHKMPEILLPALLIAMFLTFIARPAAVFMLLLPFKASLNQCLLVSWAGLRGAASVVFAVLVVASIDSFPRYDLFHIVFLIALISVAIQGTLLPFVAKLTGMIDNNSDVRKTFNDYQEEAKVSLVQIEINDEHVWNNKLLKEIELPHDTLVLMIKRNNEQIIPRGNNKIKNGDMLVLSAPAYKSDTKVDLEEIIITQTHKWNGKYISELELPHYTLIALLSREGKAVVPRGKTKLLEDDVVVLYKQESS